MANPMMPEGKAKKEKKQDQSSFTQHLCNYCPEECVLYAGGQWLCPWHAHLKSTGRVDSPYEQRPAAKEIWDRSWSDKKSLFDECIERIRPEWKLQKGESRSEYKKRILTTARKMGAPL